MVQSVIVHLEGVTKQFEKSQVPAVQEISFSLRRGDILGLLGPSGCGKTTLLRLIAGFEVPQRGSIAIADYPVAGQGVWIPPEKRDVGIVFQDYALFPHLSVADNIRFGLQPQRRPPQAVKQRVREVLELVGLEGLQNRYPHELSGGQQQRVALARALAPQPNLILLDEPLSNLDVQVRGRLREEIRRILKTSGISAIFVTHDREEALCISDWIGVMRQGQLEQWGTPETLYNQPATRFVAEFVTQANFIPARRKEQGWETEVGWFKAPSFESLTVGELAIREEDLSIQPDDHGSVVIRDRQFLGRDYRYRLLTPSGRELRAITTTFNPLPVGTKVQLAIDPEVIRIFPRDRRLETPTSVALTC